MTDFNAFFRKKKKSRPDRKSAAIADLEYIYLKGLRKIEKSLFLVGKTITVKTKLMTQIK